MRIATLRKSGSGGRRDRAGRKPKLTRLQRRSIGEVCEAVVRARRREACEATARARREGRVKYKLTGEGGSATPPARPMGRRGESIRAKIIASVIPWCFYKYRIVVTSSYVDACWRECRKSARRHRLLGREPELAMSAAEERASSAALNADDRIRKLEALAARPGTPAEGDAAQAAIDRLTQRKARVS
jgi:hypothetical protein